jgi:RimJ/RimL family protein N-acetyltransferase
VKTLAAAPAIRTTRLCLRAWQPDDLPAFAALNADVEVMRYFPSLLDRAASDAMATRIRNGLVEHGFGLWAVEVEGGPPFIGFVGLSVPRWTASLAPCVELGWRLARAAWGNGYATEAARAAVAFAWERGIDELVAFTVPENIRSRAVMERLGMQRDPSEDFDHPALEVSSPLRRHVLYRLRSTTRA